MDVKTVCLGMLTSGPACGYELKKSFESTFGHFFQAGYGSIYPALAALADEGMVRCVEVPQEGRPDRKVYSITSRGRDRLNAALDNPAPAHKIRSEFLATLFFAHLMSGDKVNAVLDNRIREVDGFLRAIASIDVDDASDWPPGARFVAGFGVAMAKACKQYIEENRDLLLETDANDVKSAEGWR